MLFTKIYGTKHHSEWKTEGKEGKKCETEIDREKERESVWGGGGGGGGERREGEEGRQSGK